MAKTKLDPEEQELLARLIAQKLVLVAQACLLRRHAPQWVADAFIATRIVHSHARVVGAIDARTLDVAALLWALGFALYLWVYTPWLLRTRLDGKDG